MTEITNIPPKPVEIHTGDLGPVGDSVQFMFAKLQLSECRQCKEQAEGRMKDVQRIQKDQHGANKMMERIREFVKSGKGEPPKDIIEFCKAHDIKLPSGTQTQASHMSEKLIRFLCSGLFSKKTTDSIVNYCSETAKWAAEITGPNSAEKVGGNTILSKIWSFSKAAGFFAVDHALGLVGFLVAKASGSDIKWDEAFSTYKGSIHFNQNDWVNSGKNITDFKDTEGAKIPMHMLHIQNCIGQYNAFLQGATTAISQGVQVTTALSRGQ